MLIKSFFIPGIAHSSYMLAGNETCAIIDPARDVQVYLDASKEQGTRITHILETHLHADFISGHMELAQKTGATIYAPKSGNCQFEHVALKEGDHFQIEDMSIKVHETPGHTPEHIAYIVTDHSRGDQPVSLFCGDTLFVGDVGRPDLFPKIATELTGKLYDSLHEKLLKLPDYCEVYPAHGAGSLCGRAMGAKRSSTIGYERLYNSALQISNKEEFIKALTTNMPAAPDHFSRCSAINAEGPKLVSTLPKIETIPPQQFLDRSKKNDVLILDTRSYDAFGGMHIHGSYHIDFGGNFATFAGWVLDPKKKILLVSENPPETAIWLRRVGLDNIIGYLDGGMYEWAKTGLPSSHVYQLSPEEAKKMLETNPDIQFVDVRSEKEFENFNLENTIHIPAPDLRTQHTKLNKNFPSILMCSTGHRSSLGTSILEQKGFTKLYNLAGGITGYQNR